VEGGAGPSEKREGVLPLLGDASEGRREVDGGRGNMLCLIWIKESQLISEKEGERGKKARLRRKVRVLQNEDPQEGLLFVGLSLNNRSRQPQQGGGREGGDAATRRNYTVEGRSRNGQKKGEKGKEDSYSFTKKKKWRR